MMALKTGSRETLSLLREFRTFVLRGNVVDLAVAVVIGVAFGGVINALVKDLITPLIAAIGAQPDDWTPITGPPSMMVPG